MSVGGKPWLPLAQDPSRDPSGCSATPGRCRAPRMPQTLSPPAQTGSLLNSAQSPAPSGPWPPSSAQSPPVKPHASFPITWAGRAGGGATEKLKRASPLASPPAGPRETNGGGQTPGSAGRVGAALPTLQGGGTRAQSLGKGSLVPTGLPPDP